MADRMINIALPKGRLGMKVYEMFEKAGFECPSMRDQGRKLIFENEEACVRYFLVKPSDVPIYVERGAADIGVAGGKGVGLIIRHGEILRKVPEDQILGALREELLNWK